MEHQYYSWNWSRKKCFMRKRCNKFSFQLIKGLAFELPSVLRVLYTYLKFCVSKFRVPRTFKASKFRLRTQIQHALSYSMSFMLDLVILLQHARLASQVHQTPHKSQVLPNTVLNKKFQNTILVSLKFKQQLD